MSWLIIISSILLALGGMIPVEEPEEEVVLNMEQLPAPELEGLLHFAIRNSNLTKLREMAANAETISGEKFDQLMKAIAETDRILKDTVTRTLIAKNWETEEEFLNGMELIQDYGDHLLDKGDMLHKMHALEPLLDWIVEFPIVEGKHTIPVLENALELVTAITQNREPTKTLILKLRPNLIHQIFESLSGRWMCFSKTHHHDEVCGNLLMVVNSLIANNPSLQQEFDTSVFSPLSKILVQIDPRSAFFTRILSTFKLLEDEGGVWAKEMNIASMLDSLGRVQKVSVGSRLIELVQRLAKIQGKHVNLANANQHLHALCVAEKGAENEWCRDLLVELDISDEL
jgi:hypothetical protein